MRNTRNLLPERVSSPTPNAALLVLAMILIVIPVYAPDAWAGARFKTLHKFKGGSDGNMPQASLIFDQTGNLYGTTSMGGEENSGTVFQLTPNQNGEWTEHVLYSFCSQTSCTDGSQPLAGLIFDQVGNLYGTTESGGAYHNGGTVFQLAPNQNGGWTESVLYNFCSQTNCDDGEVPRAGLVFDRAGNLYGTTAYGGGYGVSGGGTIFQLTPSQNGSWAEHVLYIFCSRTNCTDGSQPFAGLIFDQAKNLYGTTLYGYDDLGTVFRLTPSPGGDWTERVLHQFCSWRECADGLTPSAGLIFDQAGNLYGTTESGGAQYGGTVFQLIPNQNGGWIEHVLHRFCSRTKCADGVGPHAGLIFDRAGNLFGTTEAGGAKNFGTVFQLTPNQNGEWTEHVLHDFADKPGAYPAAGLILDKTGNLYGTTQGDGNMTLGSVFEIIP
jgi:uncharacterized repeat protein (TIGR03803 family)